MSFWDSQCMIGCDFVWAKTANDDTDDACERWWPGQVSLHMLAVSIFHFMSHSTYFAGISP